MTLLARWRAQPWRAGYLPIAPDFAFACLSLDGFGLAVARRPQVFGSVYESADIRVTSLQRAHRELRVQHVGTHAKLLHHQL